MKESNLNKITFLIFEKKIQNEFTQQYLANQLAHKFESKDYQPEDIKYQLKYCDKELFTDFRDGKISLD